jgi:hypothetical protein
MTVSLAAQVQTASRRVLLTYLLVPLLLLVAAIIALRSLGGSLAGWDSLAALTLAGWSWLRIRRFRHYRKRLPASSDSFPSTLVAGSSGSVVRRFLSFKYLILYAPDDDLPPNIRVDLLFGQSGRSFGERRGVRVRGPESGIGPIVLVDPVDERLLLGHGRRIDASQPSRLRVAWMTFVETLGGFGGWIRAATLTAAGRALAGATRGLARGVARTLVAITRSVVRMLAGSPRALVQLAIAMGRSLAASTRKLLTALVSAGRGFTEMVGAAIIFVVRTVIHTPRALAAAAGAGGALLVLAVRRLAHGVSVGARGVADALTRTPGAVAYLARGLARALTHAAVAAARGLGRFMIAAVTLLTRGPELARAVRTVAGRTARTIGRLPSQLSAAVRRLLGWFRPHRVLLLYAGLPLAVLIVGALGTGLAGAPDRASTGPYKAVGFLCFALTCVGLGWLALRYLRYRTCRTGLLEASYRTRARVIWVGSKPGWTGWLRSARLGLELLGEGDTPALKLSLFGGQRLPPLSTGQELTLSMKSGSSRIPVAIHIEGTPRLIGSGELLGPYHLVAPDVVARARRVLRRDLIVYASLSSDLVHRHRGLSRTLNRGGHAIPAVVVGSTRPRWYERITEHDSVWLQLDPAGSRRYVRMTLLGRQDGTTLSAGEQVSIYGPKDGRDSIITVGSRYRTTLLGVGEGWSPPEQNEG